MSYLEDHVIPCLIGKDPRRIEDIWQYLYRGAFGAEARSPSPHIYLWLALKTEPRGIGNRVYAPTTCAIGP